jgi:hypothetical protein
MAIPEHRARGACVSIVRVLGSLFEHRASSSGGGEGMMRRKVKVIVISKSWIEGDYTVICGFGY